MIPRTATGKFKKTDLRERFVSASVSRRSREGHVADLGLGGGKVDHLLRLSRHLVTLGGENLPNGRMIRVARSRGWRSIHHAARSSPSTSTWLMGARVLRIGVDADKPVSE